MALLEIITVPDAVLRKKARKVTDFGPELNKLLDDMVDSMHDAPGVGLAAPQVGISQRVIVVEYGDESDEEVPPRLIMLVNPEIARASQETLVGTEGCLSIPGVAGDVERYLEVTVRGQNRHGQAVKIKAKGWLARIFQHEIDHLDGILFTDRAEKVWMVEQSPVQVLPVE